MGRVPEHALDNLPLEVLYREGPCLVVNKPAGVLTQGPPGVDSMELRVAGYLRRTEGKSGNVYVGVPHRLDRPVTGALLFARHVRAARRLSEQFEGRTVRKRYAAWVTGDVAAEEGEWRDWLRKIPGEARVETVAEGVTGAKLAILRYRVRERRPGKTCLDIELLTGRMHQIRVQTATRGHCVWGDALYGGTEPFGPVTDDPRGRAIALHAYRLAFQHPMTWERTSVDAPFPPYWPPSSWGPAPGEPGGPDAHSPAGG